MQILIIDDDQTVAASIAKFISLQLEHETFIADNGPEALRIISENNISLVISDIKMPGTDGIELISQIKSLEKGKHILVILMTGYPDLNSAIKALRSGAYDYIRKPVNIEELSIIIDRALEHQKLLSENSTFKTSFDQIINQESELIKSKWNSVKSTQAQFSQLFNIGIFSQQMKEIIDFALKCHQSKNIPVLIEGDTGTGKEIIAKIIHHGTDNPFSPFVALNCSSISEALFESELFGYEKGAFTGADLKGKMGKLELANGGTLFLDEIGDMPLSLQPKLLRALQELEIYRVGGNKKIKLDLRIICATNRSLEEMVNNNSFRKDLFYRINTGFIHIPPLKQRKNEIIPLAYLFLKEFAEKNAVPQKTLTSETEDLLLKYSWPGNIRQLKNAVSRAAFTASSNFLTPIDFLFLDENSSHSENLSPKSLTIDFNNESLDLYSIQKDIVSKALSLFANNKVRTAKYLNISVNKLRRILGEM